MRACMCVDVLLCACLSARVCVCISFQEFCSFSERIHLVQLQMLQITLSHVIGDSGESHSGGGEETNVLLRYSGMIIRQLH